jgi:hypothetical protein
MLNDQRSSYRWQDHVITPKRAALNLLATTLIVAVLGIAGLGAGHDPTPVAVHAHLQAPIATEQAASLAEIVKRSPHLRSQPFRGC